MYLIPANGNTTAVSKIVNLIGGMGRSLFGFCKAALSLPVCDVSSSSVSVEVPLDDGSFGKTCFSDGVLNSLSFCKMRKLATIM